MLGHRVSADNLKRVFVSLESMLKSRKQPKSVADVWKFYGLLSYYRMYIPNFAELASRIRRFCWRVMPKNFFGPPSMIESWRRCWGSWLNMQDSFHPILQDRSSWKPRVYLVGSLGCCYSSGMVKNSLSHVAVNSSQLFVKVHHLLNRCCNLYVSVWESSMRLLWRALR